MFSAFSLEMPFFRQKNNFLIYSSFYSHNSWNKCIFKSGDLSVFFSISFTLPWYSQGPVCKIEQEKRRKEKKV